MGNEYIKIKSNLSIIEYVSVVNAIVSEFFDEDGNYTPHIGNLNAMRVFYNNCIVESKFDIDHSIADALEMEVLVEDEDFINAFNNALSGDGKIRLDFSNAYADAIDIVNAKKHSLGNVIDSLKNALANFAEKINPILSEENIQKLVDAVEKITSGDFSAESIAEALGDFQSGFTALGE